MGHLLWLSRWFLLQSLFKRRISSSQPFSTSCASPANILSNHDLENFSRFLLFLLLQLCWTRIRHITIKWCLDIQWVREYNDNWPHILPITIIHNDVTRRSFLEAENNSCLNRVSGENAESRLMCVWCTFRRERSGKNIDSIHWERFRFLLRVCNSSFLLMIIDYSLYNNWCDCPVTNDHYNLFMKLTVGVPKQLMTASLTTKSAWNYFPKHSLGSSPGMSKKPWKDYVVQRRVDQVRSRDFVWSRKLDNHMRSTDILRHLKCFDPKNIPLLYRLMNGWTKVLNYIADDINPDVIIPNLCCSYHYMLFEGMARVREECTNRTGPETGKFIMSVIESVVSSAVDLGCGKHNSFQVCQELMWPEMQFFFNLTLVGMDEPFLVSPIIPLLKIAENLDASLSTWLTYRK